MKLILLLIMVVNLTGCSELVENNYINNIVPEKDDKFLYESDPTYLRTSFLLSYFSPGHGTKNLNYKKPPYNPSMSGEILDDTLIILNNVGRYVVNMSSNGNVNWIKTEAETPQSLFNETEDVVGYISYKEIVKVNKYTGVELSRVNPFDTGMKFIKKIEGDKYLIALDTNHSGNILITNSVFDIEYSVPISTRYVRGIDIRGDLIAIADTFNHRVVVFNKLSNSIVAETNEYYPNAVRFIDNDNLYILGEHSNRLITHTISTGARKTIMSSPSFKNPYLTSLDIGNMEANGDLDANDDEFPYSKASVKHSGIYTLYSPNGLTILEDNTFIIADTDNHRVIHITEDGGEIIRIINGLNNPSSVLTY